jgi:hypothetical protein
VRILVDRHDGHLAVVQSEAERGLLAIRTLAAHLHAADGPKAFELDDPLDPGRPATISDPNVLGDADPRLGGEAWWGKCGDHGVFRRSSESREHDLQ